MNQWEVMFDFLFHLDSIFELMEDCMYGALAREVASRTSRCYIVQFSMSRLHSAVKIPCAFLITPLRMFFVRPALKMVGIPSLVFFAQAYRVSHSL
jgi:hypothetical protein